MQDPNTESYAPGDVVKKTAFYEGIYTSWKITEGTIISAKRGSVPDLALGKDEKPIYRARYGIQKEYPAFTMFIQTTEGVFVVSQLGFNREGT